MAPAAETPLDAEVLEQALGLITAPVAVIGVRTGDRIGGLTAAWLTRVSIRPPLLLVSIGHTRHTFDLLGEAGSFSASILRVGQVDVARQFGRVSQREVDKWAQVERCDYADGTPALAHCAARFHCALRGRFRTGDHDCFFGEVVAAAVADGGPALPMRRRDYE
jgi:flavin reductase (DIM6/NTAB) family NADH-FMN oxidoreductase RutF